MWLYVVSTLLIPVGLILLYRHRNIKLIQETAYEHCQFAQFLYTKNRPTPPCDSDAKLDKLDELGAFENEFYHIRPLPRQSSNRLLLGVYVKPENLWLAIESAVSMDDSARIRIETRYYRCKRGFESPIALSKPYDLDIVDFSRSQTTQAL